jgi:hypothetical protein
MTPPGGIISAAVDGLRSAEALMGKYASLEVAGRNQTRE